VGKNGRNELTPVLSYLFNCSADSNTKKKMTLLSDCSLIHFFFSAKLRWRLESPRA
jgi:hypothetical protein